MGSNVGLKTVVIIFVGNVEKEKMQESIKDRGREFIIRQATNEDIPALKNLFKETILTVNRKDYPEKEVEDWASCGEDNNRWKELVTRLYFVVAENKDYVITGFSSISEEGYLHSMFVHKNFQGQGVAKLLYNHIEDYALQKGVGSITSEVSITAKPFFLKQGFVIEKVQARRANQLSLVNYYMSKSLEKK